jgi:hypothetical protein
MVLFGWRQLTGAAIVLLPEVDLAARAEVMGNSQIWPLPRSAWSETAVVRQIEGGARMVAIVKSQSPSPSAHHDDAPVAKWTWN